MEDHQYRWIQSLGRFLHLLVFVYESITLYGLHDLPDNSTIYRGYINNQALENNYTLKSAGKRIGKIRGGKTDGGAEAHDVTYNSDLFLLL